MLKANLRIALAVVVVTGLVVAVVLNREDPTQRALKVALHTHGCGEAPTRITSLSTPPPAFAAWDHRNDTAWRVEGCGAGYDAVVHEHREPTGRKNAPCQPASRVVTERCFDWFRALARSKQAPPRRLRGRLLAASDAVISSPRRAGRWR